MSIQYRYLEKQVQADLLRKMVFLGGPRQVGKTTLAQRLLSESNQRGYLNWDIPEDREAILKRTLPPTEMWVFDELHKYRHWRNYLKGLYDKHRSQHRILVTGSARLDYYRYAGDSLQGRYHYLRLHPLSVAELDIKHTGDFETLLALGGFPEPFFSASAVESKRWSREYRNRLIREDLSSLEQVRDVGTLELLMIRLPDLVGAPLSIHALREDLQVSHKTLSRWLDILERLYAIFRISPVAANSLRAVKKERKHYHFDWTLVADPSFRFENCVASHLLKWVHFQQDTAGRDMDLGYFRDVDGREVDFIISEDQKPVLAVECKWDDAPIGKGLRYFKARFPDCPAWQLSAVGTKDYLSGDDIRVAPAMGFLRDLV